MSIIERLKPLLKNYKITYNLLQALFKPNLEVYTTYLSTSKLRYIKFNYNKEKTKLNKIKYFYLDCRYFNFNRKVFKKAALRLAIKKFYRMKWIDLLQAFPLEYYRKSSKIKARLIRYS